MRTTLLSVHSVLFVLGWAQVGSAQAVSGSSQVSAFERATPIAKLKDSTPVPMARWGDHVAAAETVLAVGEEYTDGRVNIFERDEAGLWEERAVHDFENYVFPKSLAASENYVAASFVPSGVPGLQTVRIFERDQGGPGNWGLAQTLSPPPCGSLPLCSISDRSFGWDLTFVGDLLYVADPMLLFDNWPSGEGAVFVYERDPIEANWQLLATIPGTTILLGSAIAAQGDLVLINRPGGVEVRERNLGGPNTYGLRTVLSGGNGKGTPDLALEGDTLFIGDPTAAPSIAGRVFVHERDFGGANTWGRVATLNPTGGEASFGRSIAVVADTLYVGVSNSSGVPGRVEVFRRDLGGSSAWGRVWSIFDGKASEGFGFAVAAAGPWLFVTDVVDDEVFPDSGAAWVLEPRDPPDGRIRNVFGSNPK